MIKVRNELGESPCYLCDFVCSTKQKLAYHTYTVHNTPGSLICSYCQAKLKDVSSVRSDCFLVGIILTVLNPSRILDLVKLLLP